MSRSAFTFTQKPVTHCAALKNSRIDSNLFYLCSSPHRVLYLLLRELLLFILIAFASVLFHSQNRYLFHFFAAFLRHIGYLSFILSLTCSCYCAGLLVAWTKRKDFITYEPVVSNPAEDSAESDEETDIM